jgi:hypothetical protein
MGPRWLLNTPAPIIGMTAVCQTKNGMTDRSSMSSSARVATLLAVACGLTVPSTSRTVHYEVVCRIRSDNRSEYVLFLQNYYCVKE